MPNLVIQNFLRSGYSFDELSDKYAIDAKRHSVYNNLVLFKYNQIESPFSEQIVRECRGIILDENDNWNVVCQSMSKFFNLGEGHAATIDWTTARVQCKVDGCLDEETMIFTENGYQSIGEICDNELTPKVYSFNTETSEIELDEIVGHSIRENNDDWFEIELDNGIVLRLTGNHKVYIPSLKCYRYVKDLIGDEEFLYVEKT
jgi:hypothetical protein